MSNLFRKNSLPSEHPSESHGFSLCSPKESRVQSVLLHQGMKATWNPIPRVECLCWQLSFAMGKKINIPSILNSYICFGGVQNVVVSLVTKWLFCRHERVGVWQNGPGLRSGRPGFESWLHLFPLTSSLYVFCAMGLIVMLKRLKEDARELPDADHPLS